MVKFKKTFVLLKPINFGNDIFNEDGDFDTDCVTECLKDGEYVHWDDQTGEKDNRLPFRLLINDKYFIEFKVERGECIEATWDHRIWRAKYQTLNLYQRTKTYLMLKRNQSQL